MARCQEIVEKWTLNFGATWFGVDLLQRCPSVQQGLWFSGCYLLVHFGDSYLLIIKPQGHIASCALTSACVDVSACLGREMSQIKLVKKNHTNMSWLHGPMQPYHVHSWWAAPTDQNGAKWYYPCIGHFNCSNPIIWKQVSHPYSFQGKRNVTVLRGVGTAFAI